MTDTKGYLRNLVEAFLGPNLTIPSTPIIIDGKLQTNATFTGTLEVNLDAENDSVLIFGCSDIADPEANLVPLLLTAEGKLPVEIDIGDVIEVRQADRTQLKGEMELWVNGTKVSASDPVPVTQTQDPVGYDDGEELWQHRMDAETLPSTLINLDLDPTGTPAQMADRAVGKQVTLRCPGGTTGNTDDVLIGDSGGQTFPIGPGESMDMRISNTNLLYYKGTPGDKLYVIGG